MFDNGTSMTFDLHPWSIALGCALVVIPFLLYRRTFPPVSPVRRFLLALSRTVGFLLLVLYIVNPSLISIVGEVRKPVVLVLVDESRSMGIDDGRGGSRMDAAWDACGELVGMLDGDTGARTMVVPFSSSLGTELSPLDSIPDATGEGTDIIRAIREAWRRYRSRNIAAMVLVSDGRVTRGLTTYGAEVPVPLFAVIIGDTLERADVSIEDVTYERVTYTGTRTRIAALVKAAGFKGDTVTVRLLEGHTILGAVTRRIDGESVELEAVFEYEPSREGSVRLEIEAGPLEGEGRKENNAESIRIKVLKNRIRVLYIDQFADWNTTFIQSFAERSRRIELEVVSWTPHGGYCLLPGRSAWSFPVSSTGLKQYDIVMISDETRIFMQRPNVSALDRYVREGGGVVMIADENSPMRGTSSLELLQSVLPVKRTGAPGVKTGEFRVAAATGYSEHPVVTALSGDGLLKALPPMGGRLGGIAVAAGADVPLVLVKGGSRWPFLAVQRHGDGVSAAILGFPLWKWNLSGEDGGWSYNTFFGALIQYVAEDFDSRRLEIVPGRTTYRTGERIGVSAYTGGMGPAGMIRGEVVGAGGADEVPIRTFLFEPAMDSEDVYTASLDPLPPGDYMIVASGAEGSGPGASGEAEISVLPVSVELLKTSADIDFLRYLARVSGGGVFDADDIRSLPAGMELREDIVEHREIMNLGRSFWLFIGVIAFLALEWILRKAWGLV